MIDRLVITDEYSVKCVLILNSYFYWRKVKYFIKKILKCNVLWFYLFGQGVPNETKGMINFKQYKKAKKI